MKLKDTTRLALRILTLPIAMAAFTLLYVIAIKAPHAVESVSIAAWLLLPCVLILKISRRRRDDNSRPCNRSL